jgi:uncharacterized protein (TIGR00251 family)
VEITDIAIRVIPNASRTRCEERNEDGVYKIRIQAVPEKGKANKALVQFLAKQLGVPRNKVTLVSGETARNKRVRIEGLTVREIEQRFLI